jgi:hypothetical protein
LALQKQNAAEGDIEGADRLACETSEMVRVPEDAQEAAQDCEARQSAAVKRASAFPTEVR